MQRSEPTRTALDRRPPSGIGHPADGLRFGFRTLGLTQLWRLGICACAVIFDRIALRGRPAEFRERALGRVVAALGELKGPFAKAGQFAAVRHDLLSGTVTELLASLRDRVPPLPFSTIRRSVEAELGEVLEASFERFDPSPLGAASIAQVHRARLRTGEEVAVKVQYPWLERSLAADLAIVRSLLTLLSWRTPQHRLDRRRVFDEFAAGLREELDFEREARIAGEIAGNLADDPQIVVPRVFPGQSTRRVMTMSYHPAVSITARDRLKEMGVDAHAVLEVLARAYSKQVFVDGLFHADPHPGNLFVLDEPGAAAKPRLLFVDFGLSRRLEPELRTEVRLGMYALVRRDIDGFVAGMSRMKMIAPGAEPGVRRAVARMFDQIGDRGALGVGGSQVLSLKDQAKSLLQETDGLQLPIDLLLYAKTLTYVFALGAELDPDVDMMKVALPYVLRFLAEK